MVDGELEYRRQVPVVLGDDVADVAVDEDSPGRVFVMVFTAMRESEQPIHSTVGLCDFASSVKYARSSSKVVSLNFFP